MFSKQIFTLAAVILTATALAPREISPLPLQGVYAQTSAMELSVKRQPDESYEKFINRAEQTAKSAINNRFAKDSSAGELSVTVLGEYDANILPVFSLNVSRNEWKRDPNPTKWATYYTSSKYLLGFEQPSNSTPTQEATNTPQVPPPPPPPPSAQTPSTTPQQTPATQNPAPANTNPGTTQTTQTPSNGTTPNSQTPGPGSILNNPAAGRRTVFQGQ